RLLRLRRNDAAQDAAGAEQRVAIREQRNDREVDALEAGGRALEVAVIDGEHDGAAGRRIEHAREAGRPAPGERVGAFQEETGRDLRTVGKKFRAFAISFRHFWYRP